MVMITESDLTKYRERLLNLLAELEGEAGDRPEDRAVVELDQQMVGRLSRMDALQQQAMAQATHQRRITEARRLKAALARWEEGEFGYCTDCGDELPTGRLAMDPAVPRCVSCTNG